MATIAGGRYSLPFCLGHAMPLAAGRGRMSDRCTDEPGLNTNGRPHLEAGH